MKKFLAYSSIFFVAMMAALSVSAAASDFSGTWKLDAAKSTLPEGRGGSGAAAEVTLVVKQDAKTLTVERKVVREGQEMPSSPATYNFDGSETKSALKGRITGTSTHKTKWQGEGKILEINTSSDVNVQGNDITITTQEHWELVDGGKALKVHQKRTTPRGDQESTLIFNKQ